MTSIAVIHENTTVRQTLCGWIDSCPQYRCAYAAATGKEALAEIPRCRPALVLIDVHLPGESGTTCITRLKRRLPGLHAIVVTASTDWNTIRQAFRAGADGYVLQNSGCDEVLAAIAEAIAGGVPMSPQVAHQVIGFFQQPVDGSSTAMTMSRRENEVLDLLSSGLSNKDIAGQMGISYETVCVHLRRVYKKLHVHSRAGAIVQYLRARPKPDDSPSLEPFEAPVR